MINLNVEGISFHMQLNVEDDGTLTMTFADGSVSLTADGVPEMSTVKHFDLNEQLIEEYLGAPLAKMIRDAIHATLEASPNLNIKNLCKHEDNTVNYNANTVEQ